MSGRKYSIGAAEFDAPSLQPGLYAVATPIGNLGDITVRALMTLSAADLILCEDTRTTSKLLQRYAIKTKLSPYHEHNAEKVRPGILGRLKDGAAMALVSDAGMPLVSDPGYRLLGEAASLGIAVTVCPGPSAVLTALALSGLPTDRFSFFGFMPAKKSARERLFAEIAKLHSTLIFFDSPHRIVASLRDIETSLPGRTVAVARELTKLYEEVMRGTPGEVRTALEARASIKGEITLIVSGPSGHEPASEETIEAEITAALKTLSPSQAAAHVARILELPKGDVYARIIKSRDSA